MHQIASAPAAPADERAVPRWRSSERLLGLLGLGAVLLLAAGLRLANLDALGYANHYYTAAVESMLQSWHNFFYVAAEPGGSVSVDKPPVGLWVQAGFAYVLGVNGVAVVLPQILAGLASIALLYHLVRRSFGTAAGLLAALALAITPIVVATDRNNTMDSTLNLTLLLAAWAWIKATEGGRLRWLLLGAALVGLGFNIKMLQAYLVLPAFYALYVLGAQATIFKKIWHVALSTAVLVAISLSWAIAVDLTPADRRPYVGSSTNNTVMELILGHNGLSRLFGPGGGRGEAGPPPGQQGAIQPGMPGQGAVRQPGMPGTLPPGAVPIGGPQQQLRGGGPGPFMLGEAGPLRLFTAPLSKEASWLLPFALVALAVLAWSRPSWPLGGRHQALVLWGLWLLTAAVFFSFAGLFHEYYLALLAIPIAALVGIGAGELRHLAGRLPWVGVGLLLLAAALTLAQQAITASAFLERWAWLALPALGALAGVALLAAGLLRERRALARGGIAVTLAALLVVPAIWSGLTVAHASANQSLPSAYGGQLDGPANLGRPQVDQQLLSFLQANTQDTKYLMAVPSSMQGADYVIQTGRPVLYMGGFSGNDPVVDAADLAALAEAGELRYISWGGQRGPGPQQPGGRQEIGTWLSSACTPVPGFEALTHNVGAPGGTLGPGGQQRPLRPGGPPPGGPPPGGPPPMLGPGGAMQITLYDCGG